MRGSLRKRAKDSWTAQLYLGFGPDGRRRFKTFTVKGTKRDAERQLASAISRLARGEYTEPPGKLTLGDYLTHWLEEYCAIHVGARARQGYRSIIQRHLIPKLGHVVLSKLSANQIRQYESTLLRDGHYDGHGGLAPQTVLHHHSLLFSALHQAEIDGKVGRNVMQGVSPPRVEKYRHKVLTWGDVRRFLVAARSSPYYHVYVLALQTGLRRSELLGLRWRDVDLINSALHINQALIQLVGGTVISSTKSGRGRSVQLPAAARDMLRAHREHQESDARIALMRVDSDSLVFARPDGTPLRPDSVSHSFTKALHTAGLNGVRLHDLRHTHASLMLSQNVPTKIVSERLGHSSIGITADLYSHVLPGIQQGAADTFGETWEREISS